MRLARERSLLTPAAALLAVLASLAWVRLGPPVVVLAALPILGVVLLTWRSDVTALVLPLCLVPQAVSIAGLYASASDLLVVGLGCCLLAALAAGLDPHRVVNPLTVPAVAFVAWTLASAAWSAGPVKAVVDAAQRMEFTVLGVALMAALPLDGRHVRRALVGLVAGTAVLGFATVVIGILEHRYLGVYPLGIHKNAAGSLLAYGLIAGFGLRLASPRRANGRWLDAAGLVTLAGLVFTGSRGAWVGTLVAAATVVAMRRPHLVWPVASVTVVAVALFLLLFPPDTLADEAGFDERYSTASVRADTWRAGVQTIVAHPVLGIGAGNFVARIDGKDFQADPNNLFLLTWAETGLPGLVLLLWFLAACLRLAWRNARAPDPPAAAAAANRIGVAMLVAAVVHGQFDVFWTRGTGLAAFLGAGLVAWAGRAVAAERPPLPAPARVPATARSRCS